MNWEERVEAMIDRLASLMIELEDAGDDDIMPDEFALIEEQYIIADMAMGKIQSLLRESRMRLEEREC